MRPSDTVCMAAYGDCGPGYVGTEIAYQQGGYETQPSSSNTAPQVERVLCGHLHRSIQSRWAGTVASTAPSTAHQVVLDVREDAALGFTLEPPGYALHLWRPDVGLVSHVATVGDFLTYTLGLKASFLFFTTPRFLFGSDSHLLFSTSSSFFVGSRSSCTRSGPSTRAGKGSCWPTPSSSSAAARKARWSWPTRC